ncbi:MAG: DUF1830 domain-containing protein, partial [Leptolyngbya sp. SIO4C1]|nr:DUF1830 domain-containing protein [Leptolyngbya sp. SIO4C1]
MKNVIDARRPDLDGGASTEVVCCYRNSTERLQIVRVTKLPSYCLERTLAPNQTLTFKADPQARLEVYQY